MKWMMDAGKGPATQAEDRRPIDEGSRYSKAWIPPWTLIRLINKVNSFRFLSEKLTIE